MKIEIPKPNESGSCPSSCPLFRHMETIGCAEFVKRPPLLGYAPGPDCIAGVYELVPERLFDALTAKVIPQALENAANLSQFDGQEQEARARQWAAEYVKEAIEIARAALEVKP